MDKVKSKRRRLQSSMVGKNVWKIVAISVIIVFAAFLIVGFFKAHHIKSSFVRPTQAQIDYTKGVAADKLQSAGVNVSGFQVEVIDRMPRQQNDGVRNIIQVSFRNDSITHVYLVDVDSGEVLLHSETEFFGSFGDERKPLRHEGPSSFNIFPLMPKFLW